MKASELFDLSDKVAVITGGAGSIGVAYGRALGEAGASVVLADVDHLRERLGASPAQLLADSLHGAALHVGQHDAHPLVGAAPRESRPDPAPRARDHRHPTEQLLHLTLLASGSDPGASAPTSASSPARASTDATRIGQPGGSASPRREK